MTFKIAVCAGHSRYDTPGKETPDGEKEWTFNDKVLRAFQDEINQYENVEVRRFDDPTGKTDIPLSVRTSKANAWGADIYISFHHNANTGKWGNWTGTETFIYVGSNPKSEKLAACVHPEMVRAYGLRDRGIKKGNLHIVRETNMPAILLEGCYMDSVIDIVKLRDDNVLKNAGIGVANGVAQYANLRRKASPKPPTPPTAQGVYWDGVEMRQGQIGRLTILKPINLWKDDSEGKLEMVRILQPSEVYRVYGARDEHGGQLNVGGGCWVTRIPEHILYETPSKSKLQEVEEYYKNN